MPFDKSSFGKDPAFIKPLKSAATRTDAMSTQTSPSLKEAMQAPRKMVQGMEKYGGSKPNFKSSMGKK
jgi:hypothetical protein